MPPLDVTVHAGLACFRRGDFQSAHAVWREAGKVAQGAERHLLQALLGLAAASHQWSRGEPATAALLLPQARRHLEAIPSTVLGMEVSELELQLEAWEEAASRGEPAPALPRLHAFLLPRRPRVAVHRPRCPYCGKRVRLQPDAVGVSEETYVEDCPVCCRPWTVRVSRVGSEVEVTLGHEDD